MIPVLIEASIRSTVVALGVGMVLALLRPRSGAARHAAWTAVLLGMLASPLATLWRPELPVALPRLPMAQGLEIQTPAAGLPLSSPSTTAASDVLSPATSGTPESVSAAGHVAAVAPFSWNRLLLFAWLAGAVVGAVHMVAGWRRVRRLAAMCVHVDPAEIENITSMPIDQSALVTSPVVFGIRRPRIVLPATWAEWAIDDVRAILRHEGEHVTRRDALVSLLARVNRCVFWFHPLAWWLERTIAICAEHACDDAVVRAGVSTHPYAELLLRIASSTNGSAGRVQWRALGINGRGRLETRIDRILKGEAQTPPSRLRTGLVAVGCLLAVTAGMACQQQPPELRPDPDVAAGYARREARIGDWQSAASMSVEQAADLETRAAANPSDLEATNALLIFYQRRGQELFGWNDMIERRRPHLLRLIQHHPEANGAGRRIIEAHDPAGYAQARALWMAHVERRDASSAALANAASFFAVSEKPLAEEMLIRARAVDPDGPQPRTRDGVYYSPWADRLGALYAQVIVGSNDATDGNMVRGIDPDAARGPHALSVRAKLVTTDDVAVLVAAGRYLTGNARSAWERLDFDVAALGRSYLERALQIDPSSIGARSALVSDDLSRRQVRNNALLSGGDADSVIAALPEAQRLEVLADAVEWAHRRARTAAGGFGGESATEASARVRRYAEEALALAEKLRTHPSYGTVVYRANLTLGTLAIHEGDRARALGHLQAAAATPGSEELTWTPAMSHTALAHSLLGAGERESVAAFFERLAEINPLEADRWRADARAIRQGWMPTTYQLAVRNALSLPTFDRSTVRVLPAQR